MEIIEFHKLPIPLDRDRFVRDLLRSMTESLEKSLGAERAPPSWSPRSARAPASTSTSTTAPRSGACGSRAKRWPRR
jgi:hypothetical protein